MIRKTMIGLNVLFALLSLPSALAGDDVSLLFVGINTSFAIYWYKQREKE